MKARVHLREVVFAAGGEMAAASSARCFRESMRACGARPALPGRTRRLREDGSEKSVRLRCRWYVAEQLLRFEPCQLSLLNLCARLGRELFEGEDGRAQRRTTLRRRHCGVEVEDDGRALRHRMRRGKRKIFVEAKWGHRNGDGPCVVKDNLATRRLQGQVVRGGKHARRVGDGGRRRIEAHVLLRGRAIQVGRGQHHALPFPGLLALECLGLVGGQEARYAIKLRPIVRAPLLCLLIQLG
mmetsp:Transcript_2591/g.8654  ORF Transcript_2591/g.8654 Transcript_2591/m.8654 type:complete len:241 (+) Transcript_2591:814-1536(+)